VSAATRPEARSPGVSDLRKAISRPAWLTNRARNAIHRPVFVGAIALGTVVTALVSMVTAARTDQTAAPVMPRAPRPDTLTIAAAEASSRITLQQTDSALGRSRKIADSIAAIPPDPVELANKAARDSLINRIQRLEELMARAAQAPLTVSYVALASTPELRGDPRVKPLVDSLTVVAADRDAAAAAGGVDPVFVALTSRVSELGRGIQSVATEHRNAMVAEAAALVPEVPEVDESSIADTVALLRARDSLRTVMEQSRVELEKRRAASMLLDRQETRARQKATEVAPTFALLAAALVLSAVVGFAIAFIGEVRRPRVSDALELERFLGVRVLSTVEPMQPSAERGRRQADRAAPRHFSPASEGFQLAYLGLSNTHPALLMASVTGDDPAIAAVVACNLAAVAVDEARHPLVLDLDPSRGASAALSARAEPGVTEIVRDSLAWPDTVVSSTAGRDRTVDLIPFGAGSSLPAEDLAGFAAQELPRLARYYDAIVVNVSGQLVTEGLLARLPSPELVYVVQPGITPLNQLRDELDRMREAGAVVRGLILWAAERPVLEVRRAGARRLTFAT
jgi:hypothetical protein